MPQRFVLHPDAICGEFFGPLTLVELMAYRRWILEQPGFHAGMNQLTDISEVTEVLLQADELKRFVEAKIFSPQSKRALVATHGLAWGMGRVFATYCELYERGTVRLFRRREEALDWLGLTDDPFNPKAMAGARSDSACPCVHAAAQAVRPDSSGRHPAPA